MGEGGVSHGGYRGLGQLKGVGRVTEQPPAGNALAVGEA